VACAAQLAIFLCCQLRSSAAVRTAAQAAEVRSLASRFRPELVPAQAELLP